MIAVQIGIWKEDRDEANLEANYLNRLRLNITNDMRIWSLIPSRLDSKDAALIGVLDWLNNSNFEEDHLRELATQLASGSRLAYGALSQANKTAFDELVSTGRLHLITNSGLRENLQIYYQHVEAQQVRITGRETKYAQRAYELVPRDSEFTFMPSLQYDDLKEIGERALSTDLKSLVIGERNRSRLRREIGSVLSNRANELLVQIEEEIAEAELAN